MAPVRKVDVVKFVFGMLLVVLDEIRDRHSPETTDVCVDRLNVPQILVVLSHLVILKACIYSTDQLCSIYGRLQSYEER